MIPKSYSLLFVAKNENSNLEMGKQRCLNCGKSLKHTERKLSISPLNSNPLAILNAYYYDVYKNAVQRNGFANGNTDEMCDSCFLTGNILLNAHKLFIGRTKSNSLIGHITDRCQNDMNERTERKSKSKEVKPSCIVDENILPIDIHSQHESDEERLPILKKSYIEKQLVLKIPKLVVHHPKNSSFRFLIKSCSKCGRNFDSPALLDNHVNSVHKSIGKLWNCSLCRVGFSNEWFLKHHLQTTHERIAIKFSCFFCEDKFANQEELDKHKLTFHRMTTHPFKCNYCDVAYETRQQIPIFRDHLINFHPDSPEGKAAVFNKDNARSCKLKNWKCPECDENSFKGPSPLLLHVLYAHHGQQKCSVCDENFSTWEEFAEHVPESDHKQMQCRKCSKVLATTRALIKHLYAVHNPAESYPFVCEICGTRFSDYDQINSHYLWHIRVAGPRRFVCTLCQSSFVYKQKLQKHMKIYHKNQINTIVVGTDKITSSRTISKTKVSQELKCLECGDCFKTLKSLARHRRWNHVKKDFGVSVAGRYSSVDDSKYIMKKDDGTFGCSLCPYVGRRSDALIRHLFTNHSVNLRHYKSLVPKKCHICEKMLSTSGALKRHLKIVHEGGQRIRNVNCGRGEFRKLNCSFCKEELIGVGRFRLHLQNAHSGSKKARMAAFNNELEKNTEEKLKSSSTSEIPNDENKCLTCDVLFPTIVEKDRHDETVHSLKIKCLVCEMEFPNEDQCRKHENVHKYISCRICKQILATSQDYHSHFERTHLDLPFICEFCGKSISGMINLRAHYYIHTTEYLKGKQFKCGVCKSQFKKEAALQGHLKGGCCSRKRLPRSERKNHGCKICNKSFNLISKYTTHMENFHKILANVKCKECDKLFFHVHGFNSHFKMAHGKKLHNSPTTNCCSVVENEKEGEKNQDAAKKPNYTCPKCNLGLATVDSYNFHLDYYHLKSKRSSISVNTKKRKSSQSQKGDIQSAQDLKFKRLRRNAKRKGFSGNYAESE